MVADARQNYKKRVDLALKLFEINAFKFGEFKVKSGLMSPVYFDLRVIISYPDVMDLVADILLDFLKESNITCDNLCGVPYTALPIATLISVKDNKPMLIRRKEAKAYGTKKLIEGNFKAGDVSLIIEDVVTSGSSILETVNDLRNEGLSVTDTIVLVNREQGGAGNIERKDIKVHSLFTLTELLKILSAANKIDESMVQKVVHYLGNSQINFDKTNPIDRTKLTFEERSQIASSPVAKDLFTIMSTKKTNLCLAADLTKTEQILNIVEMVGPYICILKTHIDAIEDFSVGFIGTLQALAKKHNFLLMEDRKFADIGNTVSLQYSKSIFQISDWAHLVTAHSLTGNSIIKALRSTLPIDGNNRGVFLLSETSAAGNLITPKYTEETLKIAQSEENLDFVAGIVAQSKNSALNPGIVQLTPGVKIGESSDELGQQYNSPEFVVQELGADVAVVGRGIINAKNVEIMAKMYRDQLWMAYCERVGIKE